MNIPKQMAKQIADRMSLRDEMIAAEVKMTEQKENNSDGALRLAILQITPELLRELFQLPDGAEILDLRVPIDYRGLLEVKIMGAGWQTLEGQGIMRTVGTVKQEYDAEGGVVNRSIDWGLPIDEPGTIKEQS